MDKLGKLAGVIITKVINAAIGWLGVSLKLASEPNGHYRAVSRSWKRLARGGSNPPSLAIMSFHLMAEVDRDVAFGI